MHRGRGSGNSTDDQSLRIDVELLTCTQRRPCSRLHSISTSTELRNASSNIAQHTSSLGRLLVCLSVFPSPFLSRFRRLHDRIIMPSFDICLSRTPGRNLVHLRDNYTSYRSLRRFTAEISSERPRVGSGKAGVLALQALFKPHLP